MSKVFDYALELEAQGKYDEALSYFEMVMDEKGCPFDIRKDMARVLCKKREYKEASKGFDLVLTMDENHLECLFGNGLCYIGLNDLDKAYDYFERAVLIDETNANYWYYLALVSYEIIFTKGRGDELDVVESCWEKYLNLDNDEFAKVRECYSFGIIYDEVENRLNHSEKSINVQGFYDELRSYGLSQKDVIEVLRTVPCDNLYDLMVNLKAKSFEINEQNIVINAYRKLGIKDDAIKKMFELEPFSALKENVISFSEENPFTEFDPEIKVPFYADEVSETILVEEPVKQKYHVDNIFEEDPQDEEPVRQSDVSKDTVDEAAPEMDETVSPEVPQDAVVEDEIPQDVVTETVDGEVPRDAVVEDEIPQDVVTETVDGEVPQDVVGDEVSQVDETETVVDEVPQDVEGEDTSQADAKKDPSSGKRPAGAGVGYREHIGTPPKQKPSEKHDATSTKRPSGAGVGNREVIGHPKKKTKTVIIEDEPVRNPNRPPLRLEYLREFISQSNVNPDEPNRIFGVSYANLIEFIISPKRYKQLTNRMSVQKAKKSIRYYEEAMTTNNLERRLAYLNKAYKECPNEYAFKLNLEFLLATHLGFSNKWEDKFEALKYFEHLHKYYNKMDNKVAFTFNLANLYYDLTFSDMKYVDLALSYYRAILEVYRNEDIEYLVQTLKFHKANYAN